ncbi:mitochondrial ribosomal protein S25-domain-containing protein [Terfezia claveryi]|nr:mitochondrial ribosomal protein S25-domain-containing protein [Terfezia claveryi]
MGRHLRPLRVHLTASRNLESGRLKSEPTWYRVVGALPPTTTLVRNRTGRNGFRPREIVYPEDKLRATFYKHHPWELARPRIVLENDGRDGERWDWSKGLRQRGRQVDGESVIQYQLHLLQNTKLTLTETYDLARKQFYKIRLEEDIQRRIAIEEALSTGAVFDKYYMDIVFEREGQVLQDWRIKAAQDLAIRKHRRNAAYSSTVAAEDAAAAGAAGQAEGAEGAVGEVKVAEGGI